MTLRIERSDFYCAERQHRLVKVYEGEAKHVHRLLCPVCDAEVIEELEERNAVPVKDKRA